MLHLMPDLKQLYKNLMQKHKFTERCVVVE